VDGEADAHQFQLITDTKIAVGGVALGHFQDLGFELRRGLIWHAGFPPGLRSQAFGAELLEGFLDFVVVAAADAGSPAGRADVVQLLGQRQHAHAGLDKLLCGAHEVVSFRGPFESWKTQNLPLKPPPQAPLPRRPTVRSTPAKYTFSSWPPLSRDSESVFRSPSETRTYGLVDKSQAKIGCKSLAIITKRLASNELLIEACIGSSPACRAKNTL
jgi:hypothetical protein